jgi:hypothetical protein
MKKGFISIGVVVVAVALALGVVAGYTEYKKPAEETFSAFRPSSYTGKLLTRLNEGGSETTFNTTPGTAKDGSSLTTAKIGDFIVITINPGADNEEKISASAVSVSGTTATWTIINRGLSFTENAQVTANIKQHAIGETVIISNDDHYLYSQYVNVDDAQTISGIKTFSASPIVPTPTTDMQAATKKYADDLAIAGSPDATESVKGIIEIATQAELYASTSVGSTGARLVLPLTYATTTNYKYYLGTGAQPGAYIPITDPTTGQLDPSLVNFDFAYSGNNTITGLVTYSATTTFATTTHTIVYVGTTTAPQTNRPQLYVDKTAVIGYASTTGITVSGLASTTDMTVSGTCTGCSAEGREVTTGSKGSGSTFNSTATCSSGKVVVGGGCYWDTTGTPSYVMSSYPASDTTWYCNASNAGVAGSGNITAYAICVTP